MLYVYNAVQFYFYTRFMIFYQFYFVNWVLFSLITDIVYMFVCYIDMAHNSFEIN